MKYSLQNFQLFTLNVGYAVHHSDWNWKHVHSPFARLYYVAEGQARIRIPSVRTDQPDREILLRPGHMYVIPPFTMHDELCDGLFCHFYAHVYENPENGVLLFDNYSLPYELEADDMAFGLFKRLAEMNPSMRLPESNPESYDNQSSLLSCVSRNSRLPLSDVLEMRGIIYVLLSRFFRSAEVRQDLSDSRIAQSVAWIRRHPHEDIDIQDLAARACMSKDHFIRRFKSETGQTPLAYITQRRMEHAELLLITTGLNVKEIAIRLGYEDYSYFNRVFRKWVGMTPLEYREKSGKNK